VADALIEGLLALDVSVAAVLAVALGVVLAVAFAARVTSRSNATWTQP
jgi:hypothetical protein